MVRSAPEPSLYELYEGHVQNCDGKTLRPASVIHGGRLQITIPGIAPDGPPPAFPEIVHEDDELIVINKPAGLMCHPAGNTFTWAVIGLARDRWPDEPIDLIHRIDRDTSGLLMLSRTLAANQWYKQVIQTTDCSKVYLAIVKGCPDWDRQELTAPIGPAGGVIRIQMAARPDGLPAHTSVTVLQRNPAANLTLVRCQIHTGRTHQIRVHLAHAGFPLLGDRMYGVPPEVFLHAWESGPDQTTFRASGAPRARSPLCGAGVTSTQ